MRTSSSRDGCRCQLCGATSHLVCDHLVPQALGEDETSERTLWTLCASCNVKEGGPWPDEEAVERWIASGGELPPAYTRLLSSRPWREANVPAKQWLALIVEERRKRSRWTQERVRQEVEPFLAGRKDWPRKEEFFAAGLGELYGAINRHGGVYVWAELMGVQRRRRRYLSGTPVS